MGRGHIRIVQRHLQTSIDVPKCLLHVSALPTGSAVRHVHHAICRCHSVQDHRQFGWEQWNRTKCNALYAIAVQSDIVVGWQSDGHNRMRWNVQQWNKMRSKKGENKCCRRWINGRLSGDTHEYGREMVAINKTAETTDGFD